jgi:hypothetical protein
MSVQVQLRRDTYANVAANHGAAGEVFVDTTNQRLVVQDGATAGGFPAPVTLFVGTFTIPANFMVAARALRLTAHFQITTGTTVPILTVRLSLGLTVICTVGNTLSPMAAGQTNAQVAVQWIFQATQAPSASSNVQCATIENTNIAANSSTTSTTAMPVAVATNTAQVLTVATEWATAGAGTNTIGLNQLIVEALN